MTDALHDEERDLFEQEQQLVEEEAEMYSREEGLLQMERVFVKRNATLLNLLSYVSEQESSLLARAESIGSRAKELVEAALALSGADELSATVGSIDETRQQLVERRRELLAERMSLLEDRNSAYAERLESVEDNENRFGDLETKLLGREKVITDTLRQLIMNASELSGDDDDGDDDDSEADPRPSARAAEPIAPGGATSKRPASPERPAADPRPSKRSQLEIIAGESRSSGHSSSSASSHSASEDLETRRRRGRVRVATNRFRITLEAVLGGAEKHQFFHYEADDTDDLPGLFLATPNLLKEGREVRVRIKLGDSAKPIETDGIVSWRRQVGDREGPPGMGIEIASLSKADRDQVGDWLGQHSPMVV